jgi:hypothetical protein
MITKILSNLKLIILITATITMPAGFFFLAFSALPAQAAEPYAINLEIPIPTLNGGDAHVKFTTGDTGPIADYIKAIYTYAVAAVGIVAAVVMMIGGLMWITAGGNASSISEAKAMITAALTGLVLVLVSYLVLDQVSPTLVNLQTTQIIAPQVPKSNNTTVPPTIDKCLWYGGTTMPAMNSVMWGKEEVVSPDYYCTYKEKPETSTIKSMDFVWCACTYKKYPDLNCSWVVNQTDCNTEKNTIIQTFHSGKLSLENDIGSLPAIKACGSAGYKDNNFCCCPAKVKTAGTQLTCGDNQCSKVDPYINKAAATYGVDANLIKAIIVGGEVCSDQKSSAGACGYGQQLGWIRKWCGATSNSQACQQFTSGSQQRIDCEDSETCQQFQNDPQLSINCTADLLKRGQGSQCKASINFIARCYNTGDVKNCGNVGEETYCTRVENYYNSCKK